MLLIAWAVVSVTSSGMCCLGGKQCGQGAKARPAEPALEVQLIAAIEELADLGDAPRTEERCVELLISAEETA